MAKAAAWYIDGQTVLVPVLYLANSNNRLAPDGALVQGTDVSVIAGSDLSNAGTLKATGSLSAIAGNNLTNTGVVQADSRLDLLAGNNLTNSAGGIIAGRDVSLTAVSGDVTNERTVTSHQSALGSATERTDFVDSAARVEAAGSLTINAGQDVNNTGGVLSSGTTTSITATRDVNITAAQAVDSSTRTSKSTHSTTTQNSATVTAGTDLSISAGQDLTATASQLTAGGNVALSATDNLSLSSAADETHSYSKTHKVTSQQDHVAQVGTTVTAGRNASLSAGTDLGIVASQVKATGDVSLNAGQDVLVGSALNEDSSYYYKKKKGSFGRSSTYVAQSYQSTNVESVVDAGHDLTVNASQDSSGAVAVEGGRDVTVVGSQLKAGNDMLVGATRDVSLVSAAEEEGSYNRKTKSGFLGLNKSGNSQLKTTLTQVGSDLQAGHDAVVASGKDVNVQASSVTAGNDAELHAGLSDATGNINLSAASDMAYSESDSYRSKIGLPEGFSDHIGNATFATSRESGHVVSSSTGQGSAISAGGDATLNAAQDLNLQGSSVNAVGTTSLIAGRDVAITAAADASQNSSWQTRRDAGLTVTSDRNGLNLFAGLQSTKTTMLGSTQTALASQVNGDNVNITAGRDISQHGADVSASNNINYEAAGNITIGAATEQSTQASTRSVKLNGVGASIEDNYGNTIDALKGAGKGDDLVSKVSSTLKAVDSVSEFLFGPTESGTVGNSTEKQHSIQTVESSRGSTLSAGNDINLQAVNRIDANGSRFSAGRDINVKGQDVSFGVAPGGQSVDAGQSEGQSGIKGGTSGGLKVGVGASAAVADQTSNQGVSRASQLEAVRDVNLQATNDLTLLGTEVQADRDVTLSAGNDLAIKSVENDSSSTDSRRSLGGEVGLAIGSSGIGIYGSVNYGLGSLDRNAQQQQAAYVYAGDRLALASSRDTTIAGATLRGDQVSVDVGRDLSVSSVPDTGSVSGKQLDVSATVVVGPGSGVSGSVGYGQTTGKTNWVSTQASITSGNALDVNTQGHTQLDGALVSSDTGQLTLNTGTLGYRDIAGEDLEHSYYLNVGGSYSTDNSNTPQDPSQSGKGKAGVNGWSVSGYNYNKNKEQIVRATIGAGDITVRNDAGTGVDSTAMLNRDVSKAYEVTKDEEHQTNLYVSGNSVEAVLNPIKTLGQWVSDAKNYGRAQAGIFNNAVNQLQAAVITANDVPAAASSALGDEKALDITKQLVAKGIGVGELAQWSSETFNSYAAVIKDVGAMGVCSSDCMADGSAPQQLGSPSLGPTGGVTLVASYSNPDVVSSVLADVEYFKESLPQEEINNALIAIQVALGPSRFLVSTAFNEASKMLGFTADKEKAEEVAAIWLLANVSGKDPTVYIDENNAAKAAYADGSSERVLDGSASVLGAEFLLENALQAAVGTVGGMVGKIVSVKAPVVGEVLGGAHRQTSKPVGDKLDSHHCPAKSCYANAPIDSKDGPAIKMSPEDHRDTASHGPGPEQDAYRAAQKALLQEGKLSEAIQMDVDDIRGKFDAKYDEALKQMLEYAKTLNPDDFKEK